MYLLSNHVNHQEHMSELYIYQFSNHEKHEEHYQLYNFENHRITPG